MAKITLVDGTVFEGTPTELVEVARAFEESKHVVVTAEHTFKEGDKVRMLARGEFGGIGLDEGDFGTVVEGSAYSDDPYHIRVDSADDHDYFRPQDLELVTEVETEEAPLAVGDYAKVVEGAVVQDLNVGDIVEIRETANAYDFMTFRVTDEESELFDRRDLVRATDEEVATAKAQAESNARDAIFTENGRKPNEYREGDIVEITSPTTSINSVGDIGEVSEPDDDGTVRIQVSGKGSDGNWTSVRSVTPIAFVESRLDRK